MWIRQAIPGVANLWAPEVHEHDGTFYLYYSASTFGSNRSLIALATNTTLDPHDPDYLWVDQGTVAESTPADDFNAIDPALVEGASDTPYLAFGSFWSGPYFDQLGTPLQHGGGTVILSERDAMYGPGGESVHRGYLAHHFYDGAANGDFRRAIRKIAWSREGWPVIANPADDARGSHGE